MKSLSTAVARTVPAFLLALVLVSSAGAIDHSMEASLSGASTQNLLRDSSDQDDTYTSVTLSADLYPSSFLKVNGLGQYTYYDKHLSLSNITYGGGLTLIPLSDSSRFALYASANLRRRSYRGTDLDTLSSGSDQFNDGDYDALLSLGYRASPSVRLRTGVQYKGIGYTVEALQDKNDWDLFAGVNAGLPFASSIDTGPS